MNATFDRDLRLHVLCSTSPATWKQTYKVDARDDLVDTRWHHSPFWSEVHSRGVFNSSAAERQTGRIFLAASSVRHRKP